MRLEGLDNLVVVGLGSSLSGRWPTRVALLEAALESLDSVGLDLIARSGWWRSNAWPNPEDPEFLNGVALFAQDRSPRKVFSVLKAVEREFGRSIGHRNAPRTLDLDLIAHGRVVMSEPDLVVPHPLGHERRFVMGPLAEIAPSWRHPTIGETAQTLAAAATVGLDAAPLGHAALHKRP